MIRIAGIVVPLWATLWAAAAIAFMVGLGTWQVQRLHWKQGLIDERGERLALDRAVLPAEIENPTAWHFRPVEITGVFDHDREAILAARSLRGNVGYHLLTPLLRADGSAVIVDRGWIPLNRRDPASRPGSRPQGEVTVVGIARLSQSGNWLTPDNQPDEDFWFTVDVGAIAQDMALDRVAPVFVEAAAGQPDALPIGGQTRIDLPNDHLQYAITWFALAAALAVIYGLYVRGRRH